MNPLPVIIPSWDQRVQIAVEAARGLEYLHEMAVIQIVHQNIKSANISIFDNYKAKISDLDLTDQSAGPIHLNRLIGGYGYCAPE